MTASQPPAAKVLTCEIPGCTNTFEQQESGRPPKYCGQVVDEVKHDRFLAIKLRRGQPVPGARPAQELAPRPVSVALATMDALMEELRAVRAAHEEQIDDLAARLLEAVRVATDPDQARIEIDAVHREARQRIDVAEEARHVAEQEVRAAADQAGAARAAQQEAEETAIAAVQEMEAAQQQRDEIEAALRAAREQAAELAVQLEEASASQRLVTGERDEARGQLAVATSRLEERARELRFAQHQLADQHRLSTQADQRTARAETDRAAREAELREVRAESDRRAAVLEEVRVELAQQRARAEAAEDRVTRDLEHERNHAAQRLDDQRAYYTQQVAELRAELDALRLAPPIAPPTGAPRATPSPAAATQVEEPAATPRRRTPTRRGPDRPPPGSPTVKE